MKGINGAAGANYSEQAVEANVSGLSGFKHYVQIYNSIISIDVHFLDVAYCVPEWKFFARHP